MFEASVACRKALRQFVIEMSEENYSISSAEFLQAHINSYHCTPLYYHCTSDTPVTDLLGPCTHSMHLTVNEEKLNLLVQCFTNETTHHLKYYLLMNELESLHEQSQSEPRTDLTHIYYGKELLPYVKHHYLKTVSQNFINRPAEHQVFKESSHEEETYPLKPKKRKASMKYAVGMIVKMFSNVTGVIIGWLMRDFNMRVHYAGQIRAYIDFARTTQYFPWPEYIWRR
ncbi:uncharacterized protein LOC113562284 [Ooceraea biroi]|uniref:uncharacterized protein LOC113562284 n=1 Tax=Ooceraea biroi TaxID=2015173 RepID=UPI000F091975|nr:uncharacterized protein LOC113562284 [Ooceraea biroi]XP_026826984.1 uncharacterized protein LOC113562284 [Ooceraea biroi]XP_026826985.1 uncharacterized protein LOC113562284 [Ooceraea biroi]